MGALLSLSLLLGCGAPGGQFPTSLPTTPPSSPSSSTLTPATPVPTPVPTPVSLPSFQAGINLLFYENTDYASQLPPLMAELHKDQINSVALTFPFYQAGLTSTTMVAGSGTPPENQLTTIISSLEENGFSVMLRPLLDETDWLRDGGGCSNLVRWLRGLPVMPPFSLLMPRWPPTLRYKFLILELNYTASNRIPRIGPHLSAKSNLYIRGQSPIPSTATLKFLGPLIRVSGRRLILSVWMLTGISMSAMTLLPQ